MSLPVQFAASSGLLMATALVHAIAILFLTRALGLEARKLRAHRVDLAAFGLLVTMALCLFFAHCLEIVIFAAFYRSVGALGSWETALYFSASAYTTLGHPELAFAQQWRLVAAIEGLIGFLMIGWSTGVFIADMNMLLRERLTAR